MQIINSPHYSNSSKCNLVNFTSPTRNKRVASAQHCCSSLPSNRNNNNNSVKKLDISSGQNEPRPKEEKDKAGRKKSCLINGNSRHVKTKSNGIMIQINTLKQQYSNLKLMYQELAVERGKHLQRQCQFQQIIKKQNLQNLQVSKQNQNLKGKVCFLESEIERIKKQSIKLVELWQFKLKASEQKLIQQQSFIQQLRKSLKQNNIVQPRSSSIKTSVFPKCETQHFIENDQNMVNTEDIFRRSQESIRDPLRQTDFLNSQISEQKYQTQFSETVQYKQQCHVIEQICSSLNDITNKTLEDDKKRENKVFKKVKKEITKKMEINIEEKGKDNCIQNVQPKTPIDKKLIGVNKSSKVPKIKLRKEEEYVESKSSKKKSAR